MPTADDTGSEDSICLFASRGNALALMLVTVRAQTHVQVLECVGVTGPTALAIVARTRDHFASARSQFSLPTPNETSHLGLKLGG